jgi:hypothetical protein
LLATITTTTSTTTTINTSTTTSTTNTTITTASFINCKDIDAPPIILKCNVSAGNFFYKSFSGSELPLPSESNPISSKYDILINLAQNTQTLTVKILDKYDSGSDTYYTKINNQKYCAYDILVFSKILLINKLIIYLYIILNKQIQYQNTVDLLL